MLFRIIYSKQHMEIIKVFSAYSSLRQKFDFFFLHGYLHDLLFLGVCNIWYTAVSSHWKTKLLMWKRLLYFIFKSCLYFLSSVRVGGVLLVVLFVSLIHIYATTIIKRGHEFERAGAWREERKGWNYIIKLSKILWLFLGWLFILLDSWRQPEIAYQEERKSGCENFVN